jgi:hypothetical protein
VGGWWDFHRRPRFFENLRIDRQQTGFRAGLFLASIQGSPGE